MIVPVHTLPKIVTLRITTIVMAGKNIIVIMSVPTETAIRIPIRYQKTAILTRTTTARAAMCKNTTTIAATLFAALQRATEPGFRATGQIALH
jgi:hypothetical protein